MSAQTAVLEAATIGQQCKVLHLPTVAAQCAQLAEQAVRELAGRISAFSKHCSRPNSRTANTGWSSGAFANRICRGRRPWRSSTSRNALRSRRNRFTSSPKVAGCWSRLPPPSRPVPR